MKYREEGDTSKVFDSRGDTEEIMREHFQESFKKMFIKQYGDVYRAEDEAKLLTDKVLERFLSVDFLKKIIKYDRLKLIENLLKYKNDFDIDIFSICALIYTEPKNKTKGKEAEPEKEKEETEIKSYLKRYLRRRFVGRAEAKTIPVKKCIEYPTYQCYADVYPGKDVDSARDTFRQVFKIISAWMDGKIGMDEENSEEREALHTFATSDEFDFDKNIEIFESCGYDFRILYLKDFKNCAFRLVEPDNQYQERSLNLSEPVAANRTFITDIAIRLVEDDGDEHVELAVRTDCKEPQQNSERASAFRTGFIRKIFRDEGRFILTEHKSPKKFRWHDKASVIYRADGMEGIYKELLESGNRQIPMVVIPKKASEDPDLGVASLTAKLSGYGHVIVDESSESDEIRIYYPKPGSQSTDITELEYDTVYPLPDNTGADGKPTYVYAWKEIYAKVTKYLVGKKFTFGNVLMYRELKDEYYKLQPESVENLKKQLDNLRSALNELKGQ